MKSSAISSRTEKSFSLATPTYYSTSQLPNYKVQISPDVTLGQCEDRTYEDSVQFSLGAVCSSLRGQVALHIEYLLLDKVLE